jgi:copper resistance protein B
MRSGAKPVGRVLALVLALASDATTADPRHPPSHEAHPSRAAAKSGHAEAESSPAGHVPPAPPEHTMPPMSAEEMLATMAMNDDATYGKVKLDRFEHALGGDAALAWSLDAWIGRDFDKLRIRSEGEKTDVRTSADVEALWSHAASAFWDTELGLRQDGGQRAGRTWAALGIQGLAPYWFELAATAYAGDAGRTAVRIEANYDLSLTQQLILQPRIELNAYGKGDPAGRIGSGLSDGEIGIRLRYEIKREIAPYIGVERTALFGGTADFARALGEDAYDTRWLAGLRVWY